MPPVTPDIRATRELIEIRLRVQLELSRADFQNATPSRRPAAREQYLKDLRAFSEFVLTGALPPNKVA